MVEAIIVAWLISVVGFTAAPFVVADSTVNAAIIAGIFSVVNVVLTVLLNSWVLREARANRKEIRGARQASRESAAELIDVKRKVSGERRSNPRTPRSGGRRKGTDTD